MNCAVIQPSFVPWRGYFHQIKKADCFVFYDDVQYDKHGWRNRNRIKTEGGTQWLTVPVLSKGAVTHNVPTHEVRIDWKTNWPRKHLATLRQAYRHAPFLGDHLPLLEEAYEAKPVLLCDLTIPLTLAVCAALGIGNRRFVRSSSLNLSGEKTGRLLQVLQQVGATHYISGPSGAAYLEEDRLRDAGISLEYMAYGYPEYPQLHPPFDPHVSILDLIFSTGPDAGHFIWGAS